MRTAAAALAAFVALEHAGFLVLEMFFWTKPLGLKIFRLTPAAAAASAALAANQGLYNGFLAAGLLWGLAAAAPDSARILTFFLSCAAVAGAFGAATVSPRVFFVQALPALAALALLRAGR
jgi:putative membrane protein